jgi:hypothetical protein
MPKGKFVLKKPVITIDGTNLTKRISQLNIDLPDDEVDMTTFGSDYKATEMGMRDASMGLNVFQDFGAAQVDAVLWPLKNESKKFITKAQPFEGEVSAENPCYVMGGKLFNYNPISGSVGEASTTEPTIKNVTNEGVKRCISKAEVEAAEAAIKAEF